MMYSIKQDKNEFLTKDQIREIAPSVFTMKADKNEHLKTLCSHLHRKGN
jgi:hypothetical protein